jgi:hypothetical protein
VVAADGQVVAGSGRPRPVQASHRLAAAAARRPMRQLDGTTRRLWQRVDGSG